MSSRRRSIGWVAALTAIVIALSIATLSHRRQPTNAERSLDLAEQFACPVCEGQSVAQSDSAAAKNIRAEIDKRIDQGQTNEQITAFLIGSFSESISLKPRASGVVGLVWITPVVAFVTAVAGLIVVFRRWRLAEVAEATEADRVLVERARSKLAPKVRR
ncbi:MAG: cytochrome c-type biogenesis protein CcmH [Actinobacteria bacterium]|nr:MAG: cytochrome c-type biogenesis protein CcmH [Actinomycetota bacterium]